MDLKKCFAICIVSLSLEFQRSFSESTQVTTANITATTSSPNSTASTNITEEWFVYNRLINSSYQWNDSLMNSSSPYHMNLSNQTKNAFSARNIIIILFQRVYMLRFSANISRSEYEERFSNDTTFFSGPPTNDSEEGFYLQPLRFSLDGGVEDMNITEFFTEYIQCFYKTKISNLTVITSNDIIVDFAAKEGNLSIVVPWNNEGAFLVGPTLNRLVFEATNESTGQVAFELSSCVKDDLTTTRDPGIIVFPPSSSTNPVGVTASTASTTSTALPISTVLTTSTVSTTRVASTTLVTAPISTASIKLSTSATETTVSTTPEALTTLASTPSTIFSSNIVTTATETTASSMPTASTTVTTTPSTTVAITSPTSISSTTPSTTVTTSPEDAFETSTSSTSVGPSTESTVATTVNSVVTGTTMEGNLPTTETTTQTKVTHPATTPQTETSASTTTTPHIITTKSSTNEITTTNGNSETTVTSHPIISTTLATTKGETSSLQTDSTSFTETDQSLLNTTRTIEPDTIRPTSESTVTLLLPTITSEASTTAEIHDFTKETEQSSVFSPTQHPTTVNTPSTTSDLHSVQPTIPSSSETSTTSSAINSTAGQIPVCQTITLEIEGNNLTFPSIPLYAYSDSLETCDDDSRSLGSIRCIATNDGATFDQNDVTFVSCAQNLSSFLQGITITNYSEGEIVGAIRSLELLLAGSIDSDTELGDVTTFLQNVTAAIDEVSANTMRSVLRLADTFGGLEMVEPAMSAKIGRIIEELALRLDLSEINDGVAMGNISIQTFEVEPGNDFNSNILLNNEQVLQLQIPSTAFESTGPMVRLAVVYFNNNQFFPSEGSTDPANVVSITLNGSPVTGIEPAIVITFSTVQEDQGKREIPDSLKANKIVARCVFYDTERLQWATEGVFVNTSSNPVSCHSNHLTSFAVLVTKSEVTKTFALVTATTIGCVLTVLGTFATIILHIITKKWKKNRPIMEMLHACFCIFVTYIIFLAGVGQAEHRAACIAVTALLQYFFLATWCWLLIYSRDMYTSIVKVFNDHQSHYMTKMVALAYGVPLLIVVIHVSVVIGHFDNTDLLQTTAGPVVSESYYYDEHVCWLTGYSLYIGFLIPVGLVILHNVLVIALVIYEIVWKSASVESSARKKDAKSNLFLGIVIFFLVGGTWIVMFFLIISDDITYQTILSWIFTILNTLQGLFIFLILCVKSKDIRKVWLTPLRNNIYLPIVTVLRRRGSRPYDESGTFSKSTLSGSNTNWTSTQLSEGSPLQLKRRNKISNSSGEGSLGRINRAFDSDGSSGRDSDRNSSTAGSGNNVELTQMTVLEVKNGKECAVIVDGPGND